MGTLSNCRILWVQSKSLRRLLHVQRMGSFTSAPKILNEDIQDNDVDLPSQVARGDLLNKCRQELSHLPPLVKRAFVRISSEPFCDTVAGARAVPWDSLSQVCSDTVTGPNQIRVLQWNVLSQSLGLQNDNFVCCPDEALEWNTRRFRIVEEIVQYCPDVICLQEVDHFNFLKKVLASQGYAGTFFPKPDSPCIYIKGNNGPDGCAIFYQKSKFDLVNAETRVIEVWRVQSNQVAILAVLRCKETGRELCVVTTHLKARNGALLSTLRNEQGKDLIEFIANNHGDRPLIVCGDFNAEPTEPVYKTMLSNPRLCLASAYANTDQNNEEPPYTTWKVREEGEVCHTIDYVFYSKKCLGVDSLLKFPTGEEIGEGRVPSFLYPSDHFSLVCDFHFKECGVDTASCL